MRELSANDEELTYRAKSSYSITKNLETAGATAYSDWLDTAASDL